MAFVLGKVPVSRSQRAVPPRTVTRPRTALACSPAGETIFLDSARTYPATGLGGAGRSRRVRQEAARSARTAKTARSIFACGPRGPRGTTMSGCSPVPEPIPLPEPRRQQPLQRAARRRRRRGGVGRREPPRPRPRASRRGTLEECATAGEPPGPSSGSPGPASPSPGKTLVDDAAVWSFPCLVVVPPGGSAPDILAGHPSVESFEVVREPDDAPILRMRLERLLLLHRRRAQTEAVLHDLPVVVYSRTLDGVLTSVNAETETFLGKDRAELVGRSAPRGPPGRGRHGGRHRGDERGPPRARKAPDEASPARIDGRPALRPRHARAPPAGRPRNALGGPGRHRGPDRRGGGAGAAPRARRSGARSSPRSRRRRATSPTWTGSSRPSRRSSGLRSGARTVDVFLPDDGRDRLVLRQSLARLRGRPGPRGRRLAGRAGPTRFTGSSRRASPSSSPTPGRRASSREAAALLQRLGAGSGHHPPRRRRRTRSSRGLGLTFAEPRTFPADEPGSWRSSPTSSPSPSAPPASTRASPRS